MTLSGGMKRRVMIAKALSHEPQMLFLDEPTAGVDVELRRDMWELVRSLRESGVTIILTTHYIEEAEEMADRVGVISKGELILVEDKPELMRKLGKKHLTLLLEKPLACRAAALAAYAARARRGGNELVYTYDAHGERHRHHVSAQRARRRRHRFKDLHTEQSSLEDIFVSLVRGNAMNVHAIRAIYLYEMARTRRTLLQSVVSPVLSTSLYFVVFGAAIGSRMKAVDGVSYGAFIVPGLIMLWLLTQSISNASFGIYFPRFVGTIYELLSAPVSPVEIVIGYVGAAATKSVIARADHLWRPPRLFVQLRIDASRSGCWVPAADRGRRSACSVSLSAFGPTVSRSCR